MALRMPPLETARLVIRPFVMDDLEAVYGLFDQDIYAVPDSELETARRDREEWLRWSVLNPEQLARLYQPPMGDRAIVLKESGELIGSCGYNPSPIPWGLLASHRADPDAPIDDLCDLEMGLYWALATAHRGRGYATEAARALIDHAFANWNLRRVVAITGHANVASIGVMRRLGMRVESNPFPDPPWFQVIGVLGHPR